MEDKRKALYNALSGEYDLGTYEDFTAKLNDESKRRALYDAAGQDYNLGTYEEYSEKLGFGPSGSNVVPMFDDEPQATPVQENVEENSRKLRGLWANFKESSKGLWAGIKGYAGEQLNMFTGSSREEQAALNDIERLEEQGVDVIQYLADKEDAEFQESYGMPKDEFMALDKKERKKLVHQASKIMLDQQTMMSDAELKEQRRQQTNQQAVEEAFYKALEMAGGDLTKAKAILREQAADKTKGDILIEEATETMNNLRQPEGFAGWVGNLLPQMVPAAASIAINYLTKGKASGLSKALGYGTMGGLTLSTAGMSMLEARNAGATNLEVWTTGIADGAIEIISEKIPFDRVTKRVFSSAKANVAEKLGDVVLTPRGRKELEKLLSDANEKLGGKLFSKKNVGEWLTDTAYEAAGEFTAEALQTITTMIYENPEDYPTISEVLANGWEGAKAGLFMGSLTGGASLAASHAMNKDRRQTQGYVDVAQMENENGEVEVVEVVGEDPQTGNVTILHGNTVEEVSQDKLGDRFRFTYEEFENGRLRSLEDEAIDGGVVNAGQIRGMEETVQRDLEELGKFFTPEEINDIVSGKGVSIEAGVDAQAAARKYIEDVHRLDDLNAAKAEQDQKRMESYKHRLEQTVGQRFWIEEEGEDDGSGVIPVSQSVEEVVYADGRTGYIVGFDDAGNLTMVFSDGTKGFSSRAEIAEKVNSGEIVSDNVMGLDAYVSVKVNEEDAISEAARIEAEQAANIKAVRDAHPIGSTINVGTEEEKVNAPIIGVDTDGVVVQMPDGTTPHLTWADVAHADKKEVKPKTNADLDQEIVDQYKVAYAPAVKTGQEPSTTAKEVMVEQNTPAEPLPLKADGSVDQTALWNKNPERWVQWNDEQRQDGGANSLAYVSGAIAKEQAKIAELQAAYAAESDFDARDVIEKEIADTQARVERLSTIRRGYIATAEAAPVVEAEPAAPRRAQQMREQEIEELNSRNERRLRVTSDEKDRAKIIESYLDKISEGSVPIVYLTVDNYEEVMKKNGCGPRTIASVKYAVDHGKRVGGFMSNDRVFIMTANISSIEEARVTYVHERQHVFTRSSDIVERILATGVKYEELQEWVRKFAKDDFYDSFGPEVLADELVSFAMEKAYTYEDFSVALQELGVDESIIAIIKSINDEQQFSESLSQARRRERLHPHAVGNYQRRSSAYEGNSTEISSRLLGQQDDGTAGDGYGRARFGEEGEGAEVTPEGPSFRVTSEMDADYRNAIEQGDEEIAQQMVNAAAEEWAKESKVRDEYGNLMPQYHGSRSFGFTIFDTDPKTQNLGAHFGTEEAARVFDGKGDRTYKVFLNITNPWVPRYEDFWTDEDQVYAAAVADLARKLAEAGNEEAAKMYDEIVAEYPMAENDETLNEWFIQEHRGDTYTGAETLHPKLRRLLEIGGYDGVQYNNWVEDPGNDSWVALYPEQIKSAESATFDDDNKLIPLSERFTEGIDLRFRTAATNPEVNLTDETRKELADKGLVMDGGAIMSEDYAALKHALGYETPIERNTDLDQVRFSVGTKSAHIANYRKHPNFEERVVEILERLAERMTMNELVYGVVSTATQHTYGKKLPGSVAGPLRSNEEYIITFDLDTSCPRTFQYLNLVKQIEKRIGRPLTQVESIQLIEMMRMYGQQIPCVYCYAENKRQALKQYYTDFMEARHGVLSAASDEEALQYMYGRVKDSEDPREALTKAAYEVFVEWRKNPKGMYNPTIKMMWNQYTNDRNSILSLLDRMYADKAIGTSTSDTKITGYVAAEFGVTNAKALRVIEEIVAEWKWDVIEEKEHDQYTPVDEDDWAVNERALEVWRDMTSYAKSASSAKSVIRYTPYTDELKAISQEDKDYINGMGGVRMHSSNDFRIDYVFDYFQFMADMALYKMFGHTYTKSPEFVRIFGNSGYKINMSIAAYQDENGNIRPNADEGFDWEEAKTLRQLFPNAGTMLMATSDEQIQMALDSDWIDMCIPFHHSGLPKAVWYNMRMWQDYTSIQKELFLNSSEMKEALKADGVMIPKNAKADDIAKLYNDHFGIKVLYDKKGKRIRPHFLPGPTVVDGHPIPGHNNDHQRYLDLCKEYGVKPRFAGMQVRDNSPEGGGRVIDVTEHPRYMIFIKETSRTDSPQTPIQFNFDQPSEALGGKSPIDYAFDELEARAMAESEIEGKAVNDIYNSLKKDQFGIADQFINSIIKHKNETGEDYPLDYITPESRDWFLVQRKALEEAFKDVETIPYHRNEYDEQGILTEGKGLERDEAIDLIEEAKKAVAREERLAFRVISQENYEMAERMIDNLAGRPYFQRLEGEYELGKLASNYAELADIIMAIDANKAYTPVGTSILGFFAENPDMHFPLLFNDSAVSKETANAFAEELSKVNDPYALFFMRDAWRIHKTSLEQAGLGVKASSTTKYNKAIDARAEEIKAAEVKGTAFNFKKQESSLDEIDAIFKQLNKDPELALLHDKVMGVARKLGVKVSFAGKRGRTAGESLGDKVSYDYKFFNSPAVADQKKCNTITHELIHSITVYAIYLENQAPTALTDGMLEAVGILRDVYNQIARDPAFKGEYGVSDVYEMVAELSNAQFRDKLKEKNLFQRILDALKRLLGIDTVKEDSAYQVLSDTLDYIIDNYDEAAFDAYALYASKNRSYGRMMIQEDTLVPGHKKGQPMLSDAEMMADVSFRITKNTKATIETWFNKAGVDPEMTEATINYLDFAFEDTTEQLCAAKWYLNGKISLPDEDEYKVRDAVKVAKQNKVDALTYASPMDILNTFGQPKSKVKPINPDTIKEFSNKKELPEGIVVYDVQDDFEGQAAVRKIIDTHWGEDANPWCLAARTNGDLERAKDMWLHYSKYPKRIAFRNGKLLAFYASANDKTWWDRNDEPHTNIPYSVKSKEGEYEVSTNYELKEGNKKAKKVSVGKSDKKGRTAYFVGNRLESAGIQDGERNLFYSSYSMGATLSDSTYGVGRSIEIQYGPYKNVTQISFERRTKDEPTYYVRVGYGQNGVRAISFVEGARSWDIRYGINGDQIFVGRAQLLFNLNGELDSMYSGAYSMQKINDEYYEFFRGGKAVGVVKKYEKVTMKMLEEFGEDGAPVGALLDFINDMGWDRADYPYPNPMDADLLRRDDEVREQIRKVENEINEIAGGRYLSSVPAIRFRVTAEQDKAYMDAVEAGDMEAAQAMVYSAAQATGYNSPRLYHGTDAEFTTFDKEFNDPGSEGFFFTNSEEMAASYGKNIKQVYLHVEDPYVIEGNGRNWNQLHTDIFSVIPEIEDQIRIHEIAMKSFLDRGKISQEQYDHFREKYYDKVNFIKDESKDSIFDIIKKYIYRWQIRNFKSMLNVERTRDFEWFLQQLDSDVSIIFKDITDFGPNAADFYIARDVAHDVYVTTNPKNIKSADAVTYDDEGKVIPLSERFNPESSDIRFRTMRTDEQREQLFDKAKEHYGLTNNFNASGYMLPDGSLLDFSEANDGGDPNRRSLDHRDIEGLIMDEGKEYDSRYHYVVDFVDEGAIRMLPEAAGFQLSVAPTAEQRSRLMDYIYKHNGEVIMEITDENGSPRVYMEYNKRTSPSRIFRDMDGFFNEGIVPGIPPLRFRIANENQEIFVSNAAKAVEGIKQEKATPEQWLKMIEKNGGLKAGEDKWMGLSDFLKSSDKKTLTKQEVLDFINENMIVIEETHYTADAEDDAASRHDLLEQRVNERYKEILDSLQDIEDYDERRFKAFNLLQEELGEFADNVDLERYGVYLTFPYEDLADYIEFADMFGVDIKLDNPIHDTRLAYTTPGLDNHREIALTVPTIEPWNKHDDLHFGDAGNGRAVAWIRFGETYDSNTEAEVNKYLREKYGEIDYEQGNFSEEDWEKLRAVRKQGKKVLVIDEIQSKRHQEGRDKGYADIRDRRIVDAAYEEYIAKEKEAEDYKQSLDDKYGIPTTLKSPNATKEEIKRLKQLRSEAKALREKWFDAKDNAKNLYGIPDAPFDKNWHELAMKRMLRYAAESGYDVVAWTKGDQQIERYDLAHHIKRIHAYRPTQSENRVISLYYRHEYDDYMQLIVNPEGRIISGHAEGSQLADVVGKEMALKIMESEEITLQGDGLRVGGEGMRGFYDKMLPAFMNKYGKKWGVKVEDIELPNLENGLTMHSVPVTEEMKASVMEGQVMFRTIPITQEVQDEMDAISATAIVRGNYLKAPNGADTNLTPEQWAMVRTKAFMDWFGDWEFAAQLVDVVSGTIEHGFANFDEARDWARNNIVRTYSNAETGQKGVIEISNNAIKKYLSDSAVKKSDSKDLHLAVLKYLPEIIRTGVIAETHADHIKNENGERTPDSPINPDVKIHRVFGAVEMNGNVYRVKVTIKEHKDNNRANTSHSYEATKIELLAGTLVGANSSNSNTNNSITVANLLENVDKSYEKGKILDYSKVVDENGEPLVIWRGMSWDIMAEAEGDAVMNPASYFSNEAYVSRKFGEYAYPYFMNARNPYIMNAGASSWSNIPIEYAEGLEVEPYDEEYPDETGIGDIATAAFAKDYDAVWVRDVEDMGGVADQLLNIRPNQIKAADDNTGEFSKENDDIRFKVVTDPAKIEELEDGPKVEAYRAVQIDKNGKIYSPMASRLKSTKKGTKQATNEAAQMNQWDQAVESLDKVDENGRITILDEDGGTTKVAYNPYGHCCVNSMMNDQFKRAWERDGLYVMKVLAPESELTAGYHAEKAKDAVGIHKWKTGAVGNKLPENKRREILLTRWMKNVKVMPWEEVTQDWIKTLEGENVDVPFNVVPRKILNMLAEAGVKIVAPEKGMENATKAYEQWLADPEGYVGNTELPDYVKALNEETDDEGPDNEPRFRITGTPTDEVVADGLDLTPAQTAEVAANIFAALPEESRKKITEGLNGNVLGLKDAILQIPTSLASKENWTDEDKQMADVVAEEMTKIAGEMTRPFSAEEGLWLLYNNLNKGTDLISQASRALVQRNLGFDAETLAKQEQAKEDVRFRTVGDATSNAQASLYNRGAVNVWTRLKESFVDMQASVEELVKAIEKRTGKVAQGFENILLALNQQSSKGLAAMESYTQKFLNPMFDEIRRIMDETKMKYEDVVRYVILKHGLERNKKLAQRDARAHYQEIYDDIISKITGMTAAQKRTYLTNAQLKEGDAKAELATLQAVDMSAMTDEEKREHKKKLAAARKAVEEAEEHLKRAQKIASLSEQEAQDELDKIFEKIENGTDSVFKEMRENDYSGISSMFYDQLGVDRKNFSTEEQYQAALMEAKKDRYSSLKDIEAAAEAEVKSFEGKTDTKELWKRINAATKETLRQQYEANMISKDQYLNLRDMFEYYVPLRGFKDNTAEDMYTYYRKPNSTGYTKPILGAEGRKTEAESPFGWIAAMAGSAIASNVKNEAKLALYYFVSNRPENGIATISKTWFVDSGEVDERGKKIFKPAYPPFSEDLSSDAAKANYEAWQENMRELQKKGQAYEAGQRLNLGNAVVNISDANKPEHIVNVKVGGKDYTIIINGNPRAAQAINGDLNIEGTAQDYSALFGPILRWMSSVNTSYNPEFWITNMMRDMAFTMMAVNIKEDPAYRRKFKKNYLKAFKVISLVAKNEKGTIGDSYLEQQYKDFVKYGGVTGYTQIKDSETWEQEIENYLSSNDPKSVKNGKVMRGMKSAFHAAHRFGESLEQVSRFAAFLTARETGKSINEAINDAKEITVNFNRKGSGKMITLEEAKYLTGKNGQPLTKPQQWMVVGLSSIAPLGRRFIMFFNAAIQGLNATYKLMKKNPKRFTGWALGYAAVGMMNAVLHAMLDDDDDYLDIPQYERRNSLMIGGNGAYFKWALPQEARAFYALGDLAVETVMGRNPHQNFLGEALKIGTEILPVNPSEGWKAFMPSVAIPFIELALNEDYKGAPIYNEQKWLSEEEKERTAKWSNAYQGTGWTYVKIAQGLNLITGGDKHDAGWINLQPEKLEHLVQSAFGGTIRTADKFINTISAALDPEEPMTIRQTPFLNRFLTINDERFKNVHVNDVFDYYKADAEHALTLEKQYIKDRDMDSLTELRSSDEYQWAKIYGKYKKPLKAIQDKIKVADGTAEKKELMKQQDELKKRMIKEISEL